MRSYTCMSPWILTDFITLINEQVNSFWFSRQSQHETTDSRTCWVFYSLFVFTHSKWPKIQASTFCGNFMASNIRWPFLVIFFSVFWLQLRNLLLLCEPREFMHLMKLFFKNSADEVENAPKSLNSQGFHTTFIFGNFTDDIGNMRTLKTPTSPGTLNMSSYGTLDNTAARPWKWECVTVASSAITQCCNHTHTFNTLKTEETS